MALGPPPCIDGAAPLWFVRHMRAVRITDKGIEVVTVPAPSGDGVKVRIRAAGICGSDLHMLEHGFSYGRRGFIALSLPLGEEEIDGFAGAVEQFLTSL